MSSVMSPQVSQKARHVSEQIIYEDFGAGESAESSVFDIDRIVRGIEVKERGDEEESKEESKEEVKEEAKE